MPQNIRQLSEYADALEREGLLVSSSLSSGIDISGLTYNSKKVEPGFMIVCKGTHFKEEYLKEAVAEGAAAYVSETDYEVEIPHIIVSNVREAMAVIVKEYYGNLSDDIRMIGVTGTKGKSTTTFFIRYILDDFLAENGGKKSAICSGIENYDGKSLKEALLTTPEILELYEHINNAIESGIPYMEMEVSSQALKTMRVSGIRFAVACFLNIGTDHISDIEHRDLEDYFTSKLRIFEQADSACVNMDSDCFDRVMEAAAGTGKVVTFSAADKAADVFAYNLESDKGKVEFDISISNVPGYPDTEGHIMLAALGSVNVINAVAATAVSAVLGIPFKYIQSGLAKAVTPGRMELITDPEGRYMAIVDYAHNQISYETLLSSVSEDFPDKKLIMVFGSTGGKAQNRRKELGTIAGNYCKHIILTEDDSAEEDTVSICREIASYIRPECTYEIIPDRPTAIRKAIAEADENTIVIAAGKGREHFQKRGDHIVAIESDVDVVRAAVLKKGSDAEMSEHIMVTSDSRAVKPGYTFVAIKGHTVDGHDYIEQAIEKGATRIVCEHGSYSVDTLLVEDSEKWLNSWLVENVSEQFGSMKFIGITGTNGKTTTAFLVAQMLTELGVNNAYIGTIGLHFNGRKLRDLPNTTPDILSMYNIILEMKDMGAEAVVMEISSHALYYGRVNGIFLDVGAFTNLTEDHLDFHKTMEEYCKAKALILRMLKPDATMIINKDDAAWENFKSAKYRTVGIGSGDFNISSYEYGPVSTDMTISSGGRDYNVTTNLISRFNLYNYTMALAMVNALGFGIEEIVGVTGKVYPPAGRNQVIAVREAVAVIDYAHTPDAVEQIISAYVTERDEKGSKSRIYTITGCGGDRDPLKRPIMGRIASDMSDYVIFTNDNPRTEDPELIMKDILAGVSKDNYEVILDRAEAIRKGVSLLEKGDVLLILGKGHEEYQIIGREKTHFSDREQVLLLT